MSNLFKYNSHSAYKNATDRPSDESTTSYDGEGVHYDGVNTLIPLTAMNGVGVIVKDAITDEKYGILASDYNADALSSNLTPLAVCFGRQNDELLLMQVNNLGNYQWALPSYYTITCDTTSAGSFAWSVTINGSAKSGSVTWAEGDTIASIVSQINAVTSIATAYDGYVGISINYYSGTAFAISDATGATLVDLSQSCKVDGVLQEEAHRQWQTQTVASLFSSIGWLGTSTTLYSKSGNNNSYMCGGNLARYIVYYKTNGSSSYVAETSTGSIMSEAGFNSCATGDEDAQALYNKYGGSYTKYMAAHMVDIDTIKAASMEYRSYDNGLEQTKILASITTLDLEGNWVCAYPAAAAAYASYVSGDDDMAAGSWHLPTLHEVAMFMEDNNYADINKMLTALNGTKLSNTAYYWSVAEYYNFGAWFYHGPYGSLYGSHKYNSILVRPCLALKVS